MATTSQELNINHTYAKVSEDVGEEIEGLLVTAFLYNVPDRHNQSTPHLLLLQHMEETKQTSGEFIFQFVLFLVDSNFKSAGFVNTVIQKSPVCYLIFLSSLLKKWSLVAEAQACHTVR